MRRRYAATGVDLENNDAREGPSRPVGATVSSSGRPATAPSSIEVRSSCRTPTGRGLLYETTDTVQLTGGNDVITAGDGDSTILGGMGADTIATGNGAATILGDNGFVQMDVEGNKFALVATKSLNTTTGAQSVGELGGNDVIAAGTGTKIVLAGDGADTVTLGAGDHTVLGDNGTVTYVGIGNVGAGRVLRFETTDLLTGTGGNDVIATGDGDGTVLGGMGADTITTGNGAETILGDNGFVQMDVEGNNFAQVGTKSLSSTTGVLFVTQMGGDDRIVAGSGAKRVIGGDGSDTITLGSGEHTVLGDNALVTYVAIGNTGAGRGLLYETTDTVQLTGGNDVITAGDGNGTILGGMGADTIATGNGVETILGDNGFVQMNASGTLFVQVKSTGIDLGGDDKVSTGAGDKMSWVASATTRLQPFRATTSCSATTARWITRPES